MIKTSSVARKMISSLAFRLFNYAENNNNCSFSSNGEEWFINKLLKYFNKDGYKQIELFDIGANIGEYIQLIIDKYKNNKFVIHVF